MCNKLSLLASLGGLEATYSCPGDPGCILHPPACPLTTSYSDSPKSQAFLVHSRQELDSQADTLWEVSLEPRKDAYHRKGVTKVFGTVHSHLCEAPMVYMTAMVYMTIYPP